MGSGWAGADDTACLPPAVGFAATRSTVGEARGEMAAATGWKDA